LHCSHSGTHMHARTHTHRPISNNYCFSMEKNYSRKRLKVTLYLHSPLLLFSLFIFQRECCRKKPRWLKHHINYLPVLLSVHENWRIPHLVTAIVAEVLIFCYCSESTKYKLKTLVICFDRLLNVSNIHKYFFILKAKHQVITVKFHP
jgi:hypothetical protein